jgi:hypothetical protein
LREATLLSRSFFYPSDAIDVKETLKTLLRRPELRPIRRVIRPYIESGIGSEQWLRIVMDAEIRKLVEELHPQSLKVLEVSGWPVSPLSIRKLPRVRRLRNSIGRDVRPDYCGAGF